MQVLVGLQEFGIGALKGVVWKITSREGVLVAEMVRDCGLY